MTTHCLAIGYYNKSRCRSVLVDTRAADVFIDSINNVADTDKVALSVKYESNRLVLMMPPLSRSLLAIY